MTSVKSALVAIIVMGGSQWARGDSLHELLGKGFQVTWEGYAAVTTCVHGQDSYELGPHLFVCDQYTYEYPYHYGHVALAAAGLEGRAVMLSYLCLVDGNRERDCMPGSLYPR